MDLAWAPCVRNNEVYQISGVPCQRGPPYLVPIAGGMILRRDLPYHKAFACAILLPGKIRAVRNIVDFRLNGPAFP